MNLWTLHQWSPKGRVLLKGDMKFIYQHCCLMRQAQLKAEHGVTPGLAVILVGSRKDSQSYAGDLARGFPLVRNIYCWTDLWINGWTHVLVPPRSRGPQQEEGC